MRKCLLYKAGRQFREALIREVPSHPRQLILGTVIKETEQAMGSKQASKQHASVDSASVLVSKFPS